MLHVVFETDAPTTAPTEIGQHWFDVTNKKSYISVGTDDVDDWKETTSSGITGSEYTGSNLGSGVAVFAQLDGTDFQFRTLEAGPNIGLEVVGDTILISGTASVSGTVSGTGSDIGTVGFFNTPLAPEVTAEGWIRADGALYPDAVRRKVLNVTDSGRWTDSMVSITYDPTRERLLAADGSGKFGYSDDHGQTWTLYGDQYVYLNGYRILVLANGDYLALGQAVDSDGRLIMYSLDGGESWGDSTAFDSSNYISADYSTAIILGNYVVACLGGNDAKIIYYDISGGDYTGAWTEVALPDGTGGQVNTIVHDVANSRLVVIGRNIRDTGVFWTAPDNDFTTWTTGSDPVIQGTPATITLTCTDNFTDGELIQLWNPLTFRDSPSDSFDVQIGATLEDTLNNLAAMIQDGILRDSGFYTSTHDATSITFETWEVNWGAANSILNVSAANATAGPAVGGSGPQELYRMVYDPDAGAVVIATTEYSPGDVDSWTVIYHTTGGSFTKSQTDPVTDFRYSDVFWYVDGRYYISIWEYPDNTYSKFSSTTFGNFDTWTVHNTNLYDYSDLDELESGAPQYITSIGLEHYMYSQYGVGFKGLDLTGSFESLPHIGVPATYAVPDIFSGSFHIKLL